MTINRLVQLRTWHYEYIEKFKENYPDIVPVIELKEKHTYRVCENITEISEYLGMDEKKAEIAEIIALFHDIGRYEQYAVYGTFVDRLSADHGKLGIDIIKRYELLYKFNDNTKDIIYNSIFFHNKKSIPVDKSKDEVFFMKLIRDADKLDVLNVTTDYYENKNKDYKCAIELDLPDTPDINPKVYKNIINNQIVDFKNVNNLNDFKILQISWIFDINFKPTFKKIKEENYINRLQKTLPKNKKTENILSIASSHLNKNL